MLSERERFSALLALVLEGLAAEEEIREFRDLMRDSAEYKRVYQRQVLMSVLVRGVMAQGSDDMDEGTLCPVEKRVFKQKRIFGLIRSAAAAVVIISALLFYRNRDTPAGTGTAVHGAEASSFDVVNAGPDYACMDVFLNPLPAEMLVKCKSVAVKDLVSNLDFEMQLPGGVGYMSRLSVQEGSYTFWLESGATCYVRAPAELTFCNDTLIYLHHGEMLVRVDENATGFVVETPLLKVRDLGTMFGVAVGEKGISEVMVAEGRVLLEGRVGKSLLMLFSGNGVKMRQPGSCSLTYADKGVPDTLNDWCDLLDRKSDNLANFVDSDRISDQSAGSSVQAGNEPEKLLVMNTADAGKSLGISVFMSAASMSLNVDTGTWMGIGGGFYDYWNPANWQDGVIGQGAGSAAQFINDFSSMRIMVTNDLTLWRIFMNPAGSSTLDLEGDGTALELAGGSVPEISIHSGRLNCYLPFTGNQGFVKYGATVLYPYCRSRMSGPVTVRGGTLGVDFNRDADSTNSVVLNHLQPDGLVYSSVPGQVRFGPRNSHSMDQVFTFQTTAGSSTAAVSATGDLGEKISAGQLLVSADGALLNGTYIKTVLAGTRVRLSDPALLTGSYSVNVKAKNFTTEQNFAYVDMQYAGTLYLGELTISIDELRGTDELNLHSDGGVVEIGNTGKFHSKINVSGDLELAMSDQKSIPLVPATNTAFHVDASDLSTIEFVSGSDTLVNKWTDKYNTLATGSSTLLRFAVVSRNATAPTLVTNALNGLPVIDFGAAASGHGFVWTDASIQIRTVFWVIGSQEGGGLLLGSKDTAPFTFDRGGDLVLGLGGTGVYTEPHTKDHAILKGDMPGQAWINGVPVDMHYTGLSGGYDLVAYRSFENSPRSASGFAMRNNASVYPDRTGGQILAEVIIYDRLLTDEELQDTQAYLAKKWFDRDLPGYGAARIKEIDFKQNVSFSNHSALTQQGVEPLMIDMMTVESNRTVTVTDNSEVIFGRVDLDSDATLDMGDSHVSLHGYETPLVLPVADSTLHFDASDASSLILTNGSDVALWLDSPGGIRFAEGVDGFMPSLVSNALNGLPVVDFGGAGSRKFLIWDTNVVIRSFFYVMNLRSDLITPIGTHRKHFERKSHFTRFTGTGKVWDPTTQQTVLSGECYINGRLVRPDTFDLPANQFVLLGQVLDGSSAACAFGCEAYDQNNPEDIANRTGGQQLAEVVIYNRKLTRQESLDVQAYLYWKWFGTALSGYAEPGQPFALGAVNVDAGKSGELKLFGDTKVDLGEVSGNLALTSESPVSANVAAGSELNLDGVVLSGSTVSGDSSARALDFTDGGIGELSVENLRLHEGAIVSIEVAGPDQDQVVASGTLTLDGGGTIKMHFDERDDYTGMYQIITFGSMDSTSQDNLADWQVTGNVPSKYKTVLTVEDDALTVSISERGLLLFLR